MPDVYMLALGFFAAVAGRLLFCALGTIGNWLNKKGY